MPQLWLTYAEIAETLRCDVGQAHETVLRNAWTRKHSSDGLVRVLMPRDLMLSYFRQAAGGRPAPSRVWRAPDALARPR